MNFKSIFVFILMFATISINAQVLKDAANKDEIINSLTLAMDIHTPIGKDSLKALTHYENLYRSQDMGLANAWGLYYNSDNNVYEIAIRGSINSTLSWLANYYAAMIPANGSIEIANNKIVSYKFSSDDRASVHSGWTISTLYLLEDIKPKLDSIIHTGARDIIISGHSQGAAIATLITAYFYQQKEANILPLDLNIKTYALAVPKPGNLYFAYQYEKMTKLWSYSIVNTQDWVPEVPPTTQTFYDFNTISPLSESELKSTFKKISWPKRIIAKTIFSGIERKPVKSVKKYKKYLGHFVFKEINKSLPELKEPTYRFESGYTRCSNPIVLDGLHDQEYQKEFNIPDFIMTHHNPPAYIFLAKKYLD
ncbi:lipase family protein [Myroides injenensis]|uniref:lipase family protein n=1 Tax=Myroides injenensis TaxID=1183151 RepID=UPI000683DEF4|nr:lipase family protein [Myroides injenensis]